MSKPNSVPRSGKNLRRNAFGSSTTSSLSPAMMSMNTHPAGHSCKRKLRRIQQALRNRQSTTMEQIRLLPLLVSASLSTSTGLQQALALKFGVPGTPTAGPTNIKRRTARMWNQKSGWTQAYSTQKCQKMDAGYLFGTRARSA